MLKKRFAFLHQGIKPGFITLFLLSSFISFAQQKISVSGKVVSDKDVPLGDVSVKVEGETMGTTTQPDGSFSLSVNKGATIVFSNIGYEDKKIKVDRERTGLDVQLASKLSTLSEVVVVSYGTQIKRNLTGSISQLDASKVKDMPVASLGQRLQGKFAGVQINNNDGTPGVGMTMRIRGAASINAGNSPLVVVDGFPTESGLSALSPDEIQSITVLKDAASAVLYGSRAANGVILVTTKQAVAGKQEIQFSSYVGIQTVSKRGRPDLMNAQQFAEFKNQYYEDAATYEGYTGGVPAQYQNPQNIDPNSGTNWFDVLLRNGLVQDYNLSLSSGTENVKSVVNLNYNRNDGVMINQWADRFTGMANNIYKASDKLTFGLNLNVTYRRSNITPGLGQGRRIIQVAYLTDPALNYKNPDGTYPYGFAPPGMFSTPNFYQVLQLAQNPVKNLTLITSAYGIYKIIPGLEFKTSMNVNLDNNINRQFRPSTIRGGTQPAASASGSYNTSNYLSWLAENTLTYKKTIADKHDIEAFVGYTAQKVHYENSGINGSQFPSDNIDWLNVAATRIGNVGASDFSLLSYIGRVNYNYDEKYLLSVAFRRDGSSRFGSNAKYGNFPSVSAGWIVSDENFMKNANKISF